MRAKAPKWVATGTARYEATKIPEAIKYPRELSLVGSWSGTHGAHLTFVASEDFRQTATVVPSLPPGPSGPAGAMPEMDPPPKEALRRAALDARKAFVRTLSDAERALLERRLAENLTSLFAGVSVVGGYCPLGSEISPLPATEEARAVGAIVAYPCFPNPGKPFRFLAGDPLEPGPFGIMQPARRHPVVEPDLVLVPADRDRRPRHPARPRQGPLRPRARSPEEDRRAPDRRRLAVAAARRHHSRRRLGRARCTPSLARRRRVVQPLEPPFIAGWSGRS